jgi:hypothetical protein
VDGGAAPGTGHDTIARDPRPGALLLVALSALAVGGAYASAFLPGGPPGWAPWLFLGGMSLMMVATMALGAARRGRLGALWIPLGLTLLILVGGFGAALLLPPEDPLHPTLWMGLPPRAALVLLGVGLLPLPILPVAYALTFESQVMAPGELEALRDRALAARSDLRRGDAGRSASGEPLSDGWPPDGSTPDEPPPDAPRPSEAREP